MKRLHCAYEDEGLKLKSKSTDDELSNQFRAAIALRTKHTDKVFQRIKNARNVELCFLIDATGSMSGSISG